MKRKILALTLVGAMAFGLAGCSGMPNIPGLGSKVSTASDVIEKYNEKMADEANYHTDMDMEIGISAKADGISMDIPIDFSLSADVLDGNLHGDMEMSMSFMGQSMETSAEVYVESGKRKSTVYTYDSDDGYWTVSEDDSFASIAFGSSDLDPGLFKDAEMEYNKDKGLYTVTQDFQDFLDDKAFADNIGDMYSDMASMASIDPDDIMDAWSDAQVVYVFDKDFYLKSMAVEGCEYSDTVNEDGVKVDVSASLDIEFRFSDYGEITMKDVEVPKKVVDSAVDKVMIDYEPDEGDFVDPGMVIEPDLSGIDDGFVIEPDVSGIDPGMVLEPEVLDPGFMVRPQANGDELGSYNGINLTGAGDPWADTFGNDGWVFDNEDGRYTFMTATNTKYPGVELYVYDYDRKNVTSADITGYGSYGYSIDCAYASTLPRMTWKGLTFGATATDIMNAYGTPDDMYVGTLYTSYNYKMANQMELTFYVYPDKGLQEVHLDFWGGI